MALGLVSATWLNSGNFVARSIGPAREVYPRTARPTGPAALTVLLGSGTMAVTGSALSVTGPVASCRGMPLLAFEDARDAFHAEVRGGGPAAARPDRFGVLESVFAECRELDHQVEGISRPGCNPAAFIFFLHEHRFVM